MWSWPVAADTTVVSVATELLQITTDLLSKNPDKETTWYFGQTDPLFSAVFLRQLSYLHNYASVAVIRQQRHMLLSIGSRGIMFSGCLPGCPSVQYPSIQVLSIVHLLTRTSYDAVSQCLLEGFQWNLPQICTVRVRIAEKVFKVIGQRPMSYLYNCVNAVMAEAYILTVRH